MPKIIKTEKKINNEKLHDEILLSGVDGLCTVWSNGEIVIQDSIPQKDIDTINSVIEAHDPDERTKVDNARDILKELNGIDIESGVIPMPQLSKYYIMQIIHDHPEWELNGKINIP